MSSSGFASSLDKSSYLLLLLSDSNLPTGGFVASSGLESFSAHGFLTSLAHIHAQAQIDARNPTENVQTTSTQPSLNVNQRPKPPSQTQLASATLSYISNLLSSYARSSLSFLSDSHALINSYCQGEPTQEDDHIRLEELLRDLKKLDSVYHTLTLNHVARRASTTQGIALLTLYSKAFSNPLSFGLGLDSISGLNGASLGQSELDVREEEKRRKRFGRVIDETKRRIRLGEMKGNLPICWGIFSAALGLNRAESTHLHLFLTARSLLSSSVRLNTLGPYLSQQLMLFNLPSIIDEALLKAGALEASSGSSSTSNGTSRKGWRCSTGLVKIRTRSNETSTNQKTISTTTSNLEDRRKIEGKMKKSSTTEKVNDEDCDSQGFVWDWEDEGAWGNEIDFDEDEDGREKKGDEERELDIIPPAQIWPLGELIQGRHDQLHSRLFNS